MELYWIEYVFVFYVFLITFNTSGVYGPYSMIQENIEPDIYIGKNMKFW